MILGSPYQRLVAVQWRAAFARAAAGRAAKIGAGDRRPQQRIAAAKGAKNCQVRKRTQARSLDDGAAHQGLRLHLGRHAKAGLSRGLSPEGNTSPRISAAQCADKNAYRHGRPALGRHQAITSGSRSKPSSFIRFRSKAFWHASNRGRVSSWKIRSVAEGLWLPKHFAMKADAKILLLFSHREQQDQNFFDYKRAEPIQALSSADK